MSRNRDYQPGEKVPGTVYQVHRLLGAGGMGTVYDVEDTTIGKRYVLKTLHPELGDRQDLARRMQNEARALARLHHPNIVEVFTAGVTGDERKLPFYVMERLTGQTLRYVLQKRGAIDLPHTYHLAIDLLDALDHAHDQGIVHRDVKPDNIFLHRTHAGQTVTKLLDFGIMSVLDGGRGETGGRFLGTLRYASPEQLRGEKPTPKMDIYAVGLVLFEMLAGRGPFDEDDDPTKLGAAHVHREAPLVSRFADVPEPLVGLVRAALAKDPSRRPADAFSLAAQLRTLKKALGPQPGDVSTEFRATVPAVLGADQVDSPASTPPMINVQPGVVRSALSPLAVSQHMAPSGMTVPKTTVRGMMPPTLAGGTLEDDPLAAGPTLASAGEPQAAHAPYGAPIVDRQAPTHSLAIETPRMPQHGTDPLGPTVPVSALAQQAAQYRPPSAAPPPPGMQGPVVPSTLRVTPSTPPPGGLAPMQWPAERPEVRSESGHARTLPEGAAGRRPLALIASLAVLVVVAIVVSGLAIARVVGGRSSRAAAATTAASPPEAALSAPPSAPSTPPPEPVASATTAATVTTSEPAPAAPVPSVVALRPKAGPAPAPVKPATPPPTVAAAPPPATAAPVPPPPKPADRPGPGF